jgi:hypothetical protein
VAQGCSFSGVQDCCPQLGRPGEWAGEERMDARVDALPALCRQLGSDVGSGDPRGEKLIRVDRAGLAFVHLSTIEHAPATWQERVKSVDNRDGGKFARYSDQKFPQ